jgi:hypothetical protein
MKAATLPPEIVAAIKATVRELPPLPDERLDRIALLFVRMDEDTRQRRVRAVVNGGEPGA